MRIENAAMPQFYRNPVILAHPNLVPQSYRQTDPGVTVDISPETFAAARLGAEKAGRGAAAEMNTQCRTCESRRYQDVSNDSSVSFQTPTHISPGQSASAVAAHEAEHVSNEQAKAAREDREIISQTVTLKTSICPECKTVYVSGGETRTISADKREAPDSEQAAPEQAAPEKA